MSDRHALVCSYYVPCADGDSGTRRLYHLIGLLRELGWSVDFVPLCGIRDPLAADLLKRAGVTVHDGDVSRTIERLGEVQLEIALLAHWPVAEWYLPLLRKHSPGTRVIVDSVDLHYLRESRRVYSSQNAGNNDSRLLQPEYGLQLIGELNVYVAADAVLTVSKKEAALVQDMTGGMASTAVVADCEDFRMSPVAFAQRRGITMLGSYDYAPNIDAAEFLCRDVLPRLPAGMLARHPLYIVGPAKPGGPGERIRAAAEGLPNVHVVGWVPSVQPYFERCRMSVVPLLYGAGTKRKLVQALLCGAPTVSTTMGVEGLDLQHEEQVLVADDARDFARQMTRLIDDEALWRRIAAGGRQRILVSHGRDAVRGQLARCIAETLARPAKSPLLPESDRAAFHRRLSYQMHGQVMPAIREALRTLVHPDADVLVASEGSEEHMRLDHARLGYFPQGPNGRYIGNFFTSGADAIEHIEKLRWAGAQYILFPSAALWWLDHYEEFSAHLEARYPRIAYEEGKFALFDLLVGGLRLEATGLRENTATLPRLPEPQASAPRLIAFYLPQFHTIAENDAWWGEGFTEWNNVAKALPLFEGHYQPHIPADLGYYDLRLPEVRRQQADLARQYGLHGFCYYHYWFQGKQLLERPFSEVLASGEPDFPFCLCWANEPWSRRWNGSEKDLLQAQCYSHVDDLAHIRHLLPALTDRRAITVEGKPLFLVYKARDLPDPARTVEIWQEEATRAGLPGIYLTAVETAWKPDESSLKSGFDAEVFFQPQFSMLLNSTACSGLLSPKTLRVFDYDKAWPLLSQSPGFRNNTGLPVPYRRYATVFPSWDNTPRLGENGVVLRNSTAEAYGDWLAHSVAQAMLEPPEHRIVFVNAWNEWGEGCHLEPDLRNGLAYLEATRAAVKRGAQRENGVITHLCEATSGPRWQMGNDPVFPSRQDEVRAVAVSSAG